MQKGSDYSQTSVPTSIPTQVGDWLKTNVYDKAAGEVTKRGEIATAQIAAQQQVIEKNSTDAFKKFIADKFLTMLGITPEELQQWCQAQ